MTADQPLPPPRRRTLPAGSTPARLQLTGTSREVAAAHEEAAFMGVPLSDLMFGRFFNPAGGLSPAEAKELGSELLALHQAMSALRSEWNKATVIVQEGGQDVVRPLSQVEGDDLSTEIRDLVREARELIARIKR